MATSCQTHHIHNEPISIFNFHKYLNYLWVLGIIPEFKITFNEDFTELQLISIYTHNNKWKKYGISLITYNINTRKWKSVIDIMTYEDLKNQYPYLIEKNLVSVSYNQPYIEYVLESDDINNILEPSLNPFDNMYINDAALQEMSYSFETEYNYLYTTSEMLTLLKETIRDSINPQFFVPIPINTMSNTVDPKDLCTFLNNFIEFENKFKFEEYKKNYNNLPDEMWEIIFDYYKYPKIDYKVFKYKMWI